MADNLQTSVEKAIKTENETDETKSETTSTETTTNEETVEDKTETTEESTEGELTDLEQAQAIQLFNALKDPKTAGMIIDTLAVQAGYAKKEVTAQTAEDVKDDIKSMLEEALGPDLKFLSEKLAPVIDKAIDTKVNKQIESKTSDLRQTLARQEEEKLVDQSNRAMSDLSKEFYGGKDIPPDVLNKMNQLMDETNPSPTITVDRYIRKIYNEACGELGIITKKVDNKKLEKNRNDAAARLASERTGSATVIPNSKSLSLSEAVKAAIEAVNAEQQ